tara:strand:+ start:205 stop:1077 length:873 start_codon:yes stop_codon:yes gene_type:complete
MQMGHQVFIAMPQVIAEDHAEIEGFAMHFRIPIIQVDPKKITNELIFWKATSELDCLLVITFPYILSVELIDSIGVEIINFHFAPLPQYKGAQPAFWLIKNGEKVGGITAHLITAKIDGGPVLHFERYPMSSVETYSGYMTKMSSLNVKVIQKVLELLSKNNWKKQLKAQKQSEAKYHSKPQFDDVRIDWNTMKASEVEQLCRACNPWNKGAITIFGNVPIKILEAEHVQGARSSELPGTIVCIEKTNQLAVCTCDEKLLLLKIVYDESMGFYSNDRLSELGIRPCVRLV